MAVTGDTRSIVDNSLAHSYQAVEECGFADIGPAYYCY